MTEKENEDVPRRLMEVLLSDPSQMVSSSWSQMTTAEANLELLLSKGIRVMLSFLSLGLTARLALIHYIHLGLSKT